MYYSSDHCLFIFNLNLQILMNKIENMGKNGQRVKAYGYPDWEFQLIVKNHQ